jgi:tetraacyldisaccharide-1-P 4'-kinase
MNKPVFVGRGREALDVAVATGETTASGEIGTGDEPMLVADGIVVGTDREEASGIGAVEEVTGGVVCATGVTGLADRAV